MCISDTNFMIEARSPNYIPMSYMNYLTRALLGVGIYAEMDKCPMGGWEKGVSPPAPKLCQSDAMATR